MKEKILHGYLLVVISRQNRPPEVILRAPNSTPAWLTEEDLSRRIAQLKRELEVLWLAKDMLAMARRAGTS